MRMWLDNLQLAPMKEDLQFYAWYVSGSYLLTGETKPLGRVVPNHPFDPAKNAWGAWEVAARYSAFHSDRDLFDLGMAAGTDRAEAFTIGLNWYLNRLFRVTFNYEHTEFDDDLVIDGKTLDDEEALLVQCQLEF
jgi:phosphate-selective porin OprO/OprP